MVDTQKPVFACQVSRLDWRGHHQEHETSEERTNEPDQNLERIEEHESVGWISRQQSSRFPVKGEVFS
jgi:hypothetical protein